MKKILSVICVWGVVLVATAPPTYAQSNDVNKSRIIVTTDLGGSDPDDIQSLIHLLLCSNLVDIEGIVSSQTWVNLPDRTALIKSYIDAYACVYPNLQRHACGFADPEFLKSVTLSGQRQAHMDGVGEGMDSEGSEHIISVVDKKEDDRPVWLLAWGGANTIAQALWKVRQTRGKRALDRFVAKIRVYDVLGQDDAGAWIAKEFPNLIYIRNTAVYGWSPSDEWIDQHIQLVDPFGKYYPDRIWATEGDSPAFLYLLANGLNVPENPDYGGWGGRFSLQRQLGVRGMSFVAASGKEEGKYDPYTMLVASEEGVNAIRRWREHIWNNLAVRMQWSAHGVYDECNHHPKVHVENSGSSSYMEVEAKTGSLLSFNASASTDPDGDELCFSWSIYKEAGTYHGMVNVVGSNEPKCSLLIPEEATGATMHLILEVTDNGSPSLTSYQRIVIHVRPIGKQRKKQSM